MSNQITRTNNNLATKNTNDFTVTENGRAFISQSKAADTLGIPVGTLKSYISRNHSEVNTSNGLSDNVLESATAYYAMETASPTKEAKAFYRMLAKAGAKAYIYHEAGYVIKATHDVPKNYSEALRLAADLQDKNEELEEQKKIDAPKVEFAMAVRNLDGSCLIGEFAKVIGTGQNKLFKRLREERYLMVNNKPYQKYIDAGWFVLTENTPFTDSKGRSHPTFTTRITGKGQVALEKKLRTDQNVELAVFQEAYHA